MLGYDLEFAADAGYYSLLITVVIVVVVNAREFLGVVVAEAEAFCGGIPGTPGGCIMDG